ncbi:MAG: hypothetical protein ACLPX5_08455 [Dissulfurispiraceae bacterium]
MTSAIESFSFNDCRRELLDNAGPVAQSAYVKWRQRPGGEEVVSFVEGFTHNYLFSLASEKIRSVISHSAHALGDIKKEEQIEFIEDFTCPFALEHIFHGYLEKNKQVPTWHDFNRYIQQDNPSYWLNPLRVFLQNCPTTKDFMSRNGEEDARKKIKRAIQWRLGKFYLSAMREMELFARLRESNVPVRYHLLADVLLRVDFWAGKNLVCLYSSNPTYRDGTKGRKPSAEDFFNSSKLKFNFTHVTIPPQGYGKVWLATDEDVQRLQKFLSS